MKYRNVKSQPPSATTKIHHPVTSFHGRPRAGSVNGTPSIPVNPRRYKEGTRLAAAGTHGSKAGEFRRPHDVELGPDGMLYVADPGNDRIQLLNRRLQVVDTLEGGSFDFNEPKYLALDEKGWLYVADQYNNEIKIFDEARTPVASIASS